MTEKNGFSVVAATRVTQRFSTPGSRASCWALLNRCTSSTNSTVSLPPRASSARAASIAARTSLTPAATAETSTNRRLVCWLRIEAMVVLPVPGGPHSSSDIDWSPSISWRSGEPAARSCCCPTSSSSVRGRIRTASGAEACVLAPSEPPPGQAGQLEESVHSTVKEATSTQAAATGQLLGLDVEPLVLVARAGDERRVGVVPDGQPWSSTPSRPAVTGVAGWAPSSPAKWQATLCRLPIWSSGGSTFAQISWAN